MKNTAMKTAPASDTEDNRAEQQARVQLDSIVQMIAALDAAQEGSEADRDQAQTAIQEDPLSVQVRAGWHSPGEQSADEEFEILLCTGGPAVRIVGDLDQHQEPDSARIEYQDWFTPWVELVDITAEQRSSLLQYCQQFCFAS